MGSELRGVCDSCDGVCESDIGSELRGVCGSNTESTGLRGSVFRCVCGVGFGLGMRVG